MLQLAAQRELAAGQRERERERTDKPKANFASSHVRSNDASARPVGFGAGAWRQGVMGIDEAHVHGRWFVL